MCVCEHVYFLFSFCCPLTTVLWIPENALKSRVMYLEMLSLSLSVSSSPRYNCRICELRLVGVTEQTRYTLHWCQVAQVNDCSVTLLNVKPVSHFIFVLNLMWTYFFRRCCHRDLLNVCIFENVFCISDLTCGSRWPYSKRTLGLCTQSLPPPPFPLLSICLAVVWKCNILKCKRPTPPFLRQYTQSFCAFSFFLFLFFTCFLEKK